MAFREKASPKWVTHRVDRLGARTGTPVDSTDRVYRSFIGDLTRSSYQLSTAVGAAPHLGVFSLAEVLDILVVRQNPTTSDFSRLRGVYQRPTVYGSILPHRGLPTRHHNI